MGFRRTALAAAICLAALVLLCSCATINESRGSAGQFSLDQTQRSEADIGLIMGTVKYGAGFFFPTASDILDISLLKTDSSTGLVTEISHQRIRNILNFPIQFTVHYDENDVAEGESCTLIVSLLVDDAVKAQGLALLQKTQNGFSDVELTLLNV